MQSVPRYSICVALHRQMVFHLPHVAMLLWGTLLAEWITFIQSWILDYLCRTQTCRGIRLDLFCGTPYPHPRRWTGLGPWKNKTDQLHARPLPFMTNESLQNWSLTERLKTIITSSFQSRQLPAALKKAVVMRPLLGRKTSIDPSARYTYWPVPNISF